jgi:hypothetical protein
MEEPEFKNRYRKIVFAILDDHNAHQSHNPEGNFKPFADEFMKMTSLHTIIDRFMVIFCSIIS